MRHSPTETISLSEFKATCLAVLERVRRTGASIVVTTRGQPVAEINPPSETATGGGWLGTMRGTATLADDLIEPAADEAYGLSRAGEPAAPSASGNCSGCAGHVASESSTPVTDLDARMLGEARSTTGRSGVESTAPMRRS